MKNQNNEHTQNVKAFAAKYLKMGWKPIPVEPGEKACKRAGWQKLRITEDSIDEHFTKDSNIGVLLGGVSGNLVDIDLDCPESIRAGRVLLPETNAVFGRESARRSHYLYVCQEHMKYQTLQFKGIGTLVEIRTCGEKATHFTVFPPSYRADIDETVSWEGNQDPEPAEVNPELLEKMVCHCAAASLLGKLWPKGCRHEAALAVAGYLLKGGISLEDAENLMRAICAAAGDEEVEDRLKCIRDTQVKMNQVEELVARGKLKELFGEDVVRKLDEWLGIKVQSSTPKKTASSTTTYGDTRNSRQFVDTFRDEIRYGTKAFGWMSYDGMRWEEDIVDSVQEKGKKLVEKMLEDAQQDFSNPNWKENLNWATKSQDASRIRAMIDLAKSDREIVVRPSQFDQNMWSLNCTNGTVDLRTGEIREHCREDLITKLVPAAYNPNAAAPKFQAFLEDIFPSDPDLIRYVQKVFGSSLIGGNPSQLFFILHGSGANGKGVLVNTLMDVLGNDYAKQMNPACLVEDRNTNKEASLASLRGVRFVSASETNDANNIDEALLKQLTGGDRIVGRPLYQNAIEFTPEMTIFLSTNHLPYVKDQGHSMWRRLVVIPFQVTVEKPDPYLKAKLLAEAEGILAWLVKGCLLFQQEELEQCDAVKVATAGYKQNMDRFGMFLEGCVQQNAGQRVRSSQLYAVYSRWCEDMGMRRLSEVKFSEEMQRRNYSKVRSNQGNFWLNVMLIEESWEESSRSTVRVEFG